MNSKQKTPARPTVAPRALRPPTRKLLRQADRRWQRTVRYGWDKGGANGGRN